MNNRRGHLKMNIGLIVFVVIFFYMAANGVMYLTKSHVSFCEVQPGRIVDSDSFTGFIIRDEAVVGAAKSGYVNYFINDGDKAPKLGNVCMIDSSSASGDEHPTQAAAFTSTDYSDIREQITTFKKNYSDSDYADVYNLDYQLNNIVSRIVSRNNIHTMSTAPSGGNYDIMKAAENGIISYTFDGMESFSADDMTPELFSRHTYEKEQLSAGTFVDRQSPVYKIIYDDNWQIILCPTAEQLAKLQEMETVDITFTKDDITVSADVSVFENDGVFYISLGLSNYMIRYCNDRYVDIEIVWNSQEGLKIPASAVTTKEFFMIPVDFIITEEESSEEGFYVEGPAGSELIKPVIYKKTEDYCYVDCSDISAGTVLKNLSTGQAYTVSSTAALKGVYNINKGYAMFRLIDVLYEYGDYCIIDDRTSYGVTLYDHIILDGSSASENQIIY